jgi:hypothetical protein
MVSHCSKPTGACFVSARKEICDRMLSSHWGMDRLKLAVDMSTDGRSICTWQFILTFKKGVLPRKECTDTSSSLFRVDGSFFSSPCLFE